MKTFEELEKEIELEVVQFNADQKYWIYSLLERLKDIEERIEHLSMGYDV